MLDDPVQVDVDEVESGRRSPVAQKSWLDVLGPQRLAKQGIVEQVDLPDRQVVGGSPVRVELSELLVGEVRHWRVRWSD